MKGWISLAALIGIGGYVLFGWAALGGEPDTWCGLTVAPEDRCSPYERKRDYRYPASIEWDILGARQMGFTADKAGNINKPWPSEYQNDVYFTSIKQTDIEHRVPCAEAHDSGLCGADRETRTRFARDLENLTIADWRLNRFQKSDKDPADWLPERNPMMYAVQWVYIKRKYGLTADAREVEALNEAMPDWMQASFCKEGRQQ